MKSLLIKLSLAALVCVISFSLAVSVSGQNVYPSRENNLALLSGTTIAASSTHSGFSAESAIDGDRLGNPCSLVSNIAPCWGNAGGWNDNTYETWPDWLEITLPRPYALSRVVMTTFQDEFNQLHVEPYLGLQVGGNYGIESYKIEVYGIDNLWHEIADVDENYDIIREHVFMPITATKVRITVTEAPEHSRVVELEAYAH